MRTIVAGLLLGCFLFHQGPAMAQEARLTTMNEDALVARDGEVFIAAQPTLEDLDAWAARGVTTIVNLRSRAETLSLPFDSAAESATRGLRYAEIPMGGADGISPEITTRLTQILREARGPVVLYCRSGSRAAYAYAAHLLAEGETGDVVRLGWPGGLDPVTLDALAPR